MTRARGLFVPPEGVGIAMPGIGAYLPARVVTAADVVAMGSPLSEAEIARLVGVAERRRAAADEATSDLAIAAARQALARAGRAADAVDRIAVATVSPDHFVPSTACLVQRALGAVGAPCVDLSAACSGFLYALDHASRAVATGDACVLAIAADIRSRWTDPGDRATSALFGDGAAAAVVERAAPGTGILGLLLRADGRGADAVVVPGGGSRAIAGDRFIRMTDGTQVFLSAVEGMIDTAEVLLRALSLDLGSIDVVVMHQPNRPIVDRVARWARWPIDKIVVTVDRTGNVAGATMPIALEEGCRKGRIRAGSRVLLLTAGAGFTAGAALWIPSERELSWVTLDRQP